MYRLASVVLLLLTCLFLAVGCSRRQQPPADTDEKPEGQPTVEKKQEAELSPHDRAVAELRKLDAWVTLDEKKADGAPAVEVVWSTTTPATEPRLAHLAALPRLRMLVLQNAVLEPEGLAHLKGLSELRVLNIGGGTLITDAGLAHLKG